MNTIFKVNPFWNIVESFCDGVQSKRPDTMFKAEEYKGPTTYNWQSVYDELKAEKEAKK